MHNNKTYEICLPNLVWKKYTLSCYMRIAELLTRLGNEHGFDGGAYDLVHRGTILDKSRQLQHYVSSIPNNGRIELIPITQTEGELILPNLAQNLIKVAIDIDPIEELGLLGGRLIKNTPNSITLLQCLLQPSNRTDPLEEQIIHIISNNTVQDESNSDYLQPQILYVRHVLTGLSELSSTTLQQLGIHNGSARVRLRFVKGQALTSVGAPPTNTTILSNKDTSLNDNLKVAESLSKKQKMSTVGHNIPGNSINFSTLTTTQNSLTLPTLNPSSPSLQATTKANQPSTSKFYNEALHLPEDRQAMFFRLVEKQSQASESTFLEDSFFEVTLDDVRAMQSDLTRKRVALETAPFKTGAMIEAEKMDKLARYPRTLLRVELPWWRPRVVLQALFATTETLSALYAFLRLALGAPEETTPDFKLFTAPPKRVLVDSLALTLFDAQLYPSAKLYLSSSSTQPPRIKLLQFVSQDEADSVLTNLLNDVALKTLSL